MRVLKILHKHMEQCSYQLNKGEEKKNYAHRSFSLRAWHDNRFIFSLILYTHHKVLNSLGQRLLFLMFQPKVKILLKEMHEM